MATFQWQDGAKEIHGLLPEEDLSLSVIETPVVSGGSTVQEVVGDAIVNVTSASNIDNTFTLVVNDSSVLPGYSFEVAEESAAVCAISDSGVVSRLADGQATIYVNARSGRRMVSRTLTRSSGQERRTLNRFRTSALDGLTHNSLGYHIAKTIDDRLAACLVAHPPNLAALHIWRQQYLSPYSTNSYSSDAPDAVRNANAWFAGMDITPISVSQQGWGNPASHPANLIGPRHCLTILHDGYWASGKCVWLGSDNEYYSANIIETYDIGVGPGEWDTRVCYLDAAVPAAVTPFQFLPANFCDYLPSHIPSSEYGFASNTYNPVVYPCMTKQVTAGDQIHVNELSWVWESNDTVYWSQSTPFTGREYFVSPIIPGDSGSPHFIFVNDVPILIGQANLTSGDKHLSFRLAEIQAGMRATAQAAGDPNWNTYSPTVVDLSGFQTFP